MTLQLFVWVGHGEVEDNRVNYKSFTLNDQTYHVGDCVYLYPEDEQFPPYIARILAAFVDRNVQAGADPHCIEVKWFERRVNLEPSTKGIEESEREVFELEDTDINPIGCISGKCTIVKAPTYEEAYSRCGNAPGWFFCRGYFHQSSNAFMAYAPDEMDDWLVTNEQPLNMTAQRQRPLGFGHPFPHGQQQQQLQQQHGRGPGLAGSQPQGPSVPHDQPPPAIPNGAGIAATDVDDVDQELEELGPPPQRRPAQQQQQPASKRQKVTGRTCVECGATSTPQWREGPMGPKTLCNACGVRYVRSQQKAAGQKRGGGPKNGQGRSQVGHGADPSSGAAAAATAAAGRSGHKTGQKSKGRPARLHARRPSRCFIRRDTIIVRRTLPPLFYDNEPQVRWPPNIYCH
ncbi:hypothetical protein Vretimale_17437 [Volvox reticuliferus]|uniref:GATA-type domain-containing protein n=1 Tax=Volvox reticuliferus TaxID=1737510 RepID=A0A8J4LXT8_9CHLO|nr:hypothetical protein Vretimale_17437 [Volvox reticuliferus]